MSKKVLELPEGWVWTTLGEIGIYHNGRGFKKSEWREVGRPIIRIQNLTKPGAPFNRFDGVADKRHEVEPGDLLVSWAATLDVFKWDGPSAVLNQHIFKVQSHIDPDFHYLVLKEALSALYAQAHGSGMVHITRKRFDSIPVALPPLSEQRRIVSKAESLFASTTMAISELESGRTLLRQLRARLLDQMASSSSTIPLSSLAVVHSGITKNKAKEAGLREVPYLRTANVQAGSLDLGVIRTIGATIDQIARHKLEPDDVLIVEGGDADKVGRGWIWEGQIDECLHQNHVFAVRPKRELLEPRFLAHFVNAPATRAFFLASAKQTTNLASINKTQLGSLPIPDITVEEQRRRVDVLKGQFAQLDELDHTLEALCAEGRRLSTLVLSHAISGSLCDQDASDEHAQSILKAIESASADKEQSGRAKASKPRSLRAGASS